MEHSDNVLIRKSIKGDQTAFAELLNRYLSPVYKFAYQYVRNGADAEDIAQEAFVRAWKHLKSFDTTKNFKTWIFTIAKNAALDLLKKKKPMIFSMLAEEEGELDALLAPFTGQPESPETVYDRKLQRAEFQSALKGLPVAYQEVLRLRYDDHLKFREIAEALDEPIDTIKSRHRRGVALLRDALFPELRFR
ncbi:MAG: sigma-70 family RNA polymerase sigma factor [Patescibacteria group bacterium]|nr:sigma-70 family RNA polymerase sigma factor [Patescibacteria group bacterium]